MRRDSLEEGTFEDTFFSVPAPGEAGKLERAARKLLDEGRRLSYAARHEGKALSKIQRAIAAMTGAAVRVYEEICTLARLNRGEVFPSYDYLADRTALSRRSIARVLTILENVGLLIRQRRFRRIEAEGAGPRYEQTSNVYRALLPKSLMSYLPRWMRAGPPPPDEVQREADRKEDDQVMLAQLSCRELARATVSSGPLADVLAKLGASIDAIECEC